MKDGSDLVSTTAGSNYFFSPEATKSSMNKGRRTDIWAAGVTLYYALIKQYPFMANNITDLYAKIQSEEPNYPFEPLSLVHLLQSIF
mmetsp:Transcript_38887/g.28760  ORF Transcript_38887/g.28760 Transcript_38887/m.28760 type:complete len:87 (-) Transcript_38887:194-454(-)